MELNQFHVKTCHDIVSTKYETLIGKVIKLLIN